MHSTIQEGTVRSTSIAGEGEWTLSFSRSLISFSQTPIMSTVQRVRKANVRRCSINAGHRHSRPASQPLPIYDDDDNYVPSPIILHATFPRTFYNLPFFILSSSYPASNCFLALPQKAVSLFMYLIHTSHRHCVRPIFVFSKKHAWNVSRECCTGAVHSSRHQAVHDAQCVKRQHLAQLKSALVDRLGG